MNKLPQRKEVAFPAPPKHRTSTGVEMILGIVQVLAGPHLPAL